MSKVAAIVGFCLVALLIFSGGVPNPKEDEEEP
jgi:amino acid permease